ncbi:low molecular weight protein-tyrosine-phosphatase [Paraburkholderia sediminicola]|uniref:low molecular weight protein-tyrosine-phosphatase n=1 Tax=Paraburkholderia sediminicola TaxID=458836 RepID=UPI0038BD8F43
MIRTVLTVCVGNVCRSPMAEGLLRRSLPAATITSAGIGALSGQPAASHAIELLHESDIDISGHRARQISEWMCRQADLILVMETEHKHMIERLFASTRGKLFTLGHHGKFDVFDPYRLGRERFEDCLKLISRGVDDWTARIRALA